MLYSTVLVQENTICHIAVEQTMRSTWSDGILRTYYGSLKNKFKNIILLIFDYCKLRHFYGLLPFFFDVSCFIKITQNSFSRGDVGPMKHGCIFSLVKRIVLILNLFNRSEYKNILYQI